MKRPQRPFIFLGKITFLSLLLNAIPLPQDLLSASPFWVLLLFTYWIVYFQASGKFFIALILGLLIDVIHGDILGQNALALILSSAFINKVQQSFFVSNLSTQQIYIFISSLIYLIIFLSVHFLTQSFSWSYYLLATPFLTPIFWIVVKWALSRMRQ
jgi:rod shape-determining protein MreD